MNPNPSTMVFFPPRLCRWRSRSSISSPRCLLLSYRSRSTIWPGHRRFKTPTSNHPPPPPPLTLRRVAYRLLHPLPLPISRFLVAEPDSLHNRVRWMRIGDGAGVAGRVRVEVGNRITRRMTRLPSGEIHGGELETNPLGLGSAGH
jgi:hypothetical protein